MDYLLSAADRDHLLNLVRRVYPIGPAYEAMRAEVEAVLERCVGVGSEAVDAEPAMDTVADLF